VNAKQCVLLYFVFEILIESIYIALSVGGRDGGVNEDNVVVIRSR